MTQKDIEGLIWIELVNSDKHVDFMNWLVKSFDIKPKETFLQINK
jgi:hypothetical protein